MKLFVSFGGFDKALWFFIDEMSGIGHSWDLVQFKIPLEIQNLKRCFWKYPLIFSNSKKSLKFNSNLKIHKLNSLPALVTSFTVGKLKFPSSKAPPLGSLKQPRKKFRRMKGNKISTPHDISFHFHFMTANNSWAATKKNSCDLQCAIFREYKNKMRTFFSKKENLCHYFILLLGLFFSLFCDSRHENCAALIFALLINWFN